MVNSVGDGRRRALLICLDFIPARDGETEPALTPWKALPFASARMAALAEVFEKLGYTCRLLSPKASADEIGQAVRQEIASASSSDVLVIHVLSHGKTTNLQKLYIVGSDGVTNEFTAVETWLSNVAEAGQQAPMTLFLLDICHAGEAARFRWQMEPDPQSRVWVIAGCGPLKSAWGGRFTQAIADVLTELTQRRLDVDDSVRFASVPLVAQHIGRHTIRLAAEAKVYPQNVTASLVDISTEPQELPFFENPAFVTGSRRRNRSSVEVAVTPFLEDVDEALDAYHFYSRGRGDTSGTSGCFSGRAAELEFLSPWMDRQGNVGLCVVTGSPGVGKSALLGVLVCAAHPELSESTESIWKHIKQFPYVNHCFAAVHARERDLTEIALSIARQLGVPIDPALSAVESLLAGVEKLPLEPVIIVDALDEAHGYIEIMRQLLLPLAASVCNGRRIRLLVGMRPWRELDELRELARTQGRLIDLDDVPADTLREDLEFYIVRLMRAHEGWGKARGASYELAAAVAASLTKDGKAPEWGAFLVAGLFTHHVLLAHPKPLRVEDAQALGASVPRTLPGLLELDLGIRGKDNPWLRPILRALAHAHGSGMSARIILSVVAAFSPPDVVPNIKNVLEGLKEVRFYLRHSAEVDGSTLYRLFHQGLADYLRSAGDIETVYERLMASLVPEGATARHWELAEPYLLRFAHDHALQAGRPDDVLCDAGFLVEVDPDTVMSAFEGAQSPNSLGVAEIYRAAIGDTKLRDPQIRFQQIMSKALKLSSAALVEGLLSLPNRSAVRWTVLWRDTAEVGRNWESIGVLENEGKWSVAIGYSHGELDLRDFSDGEGRRCFQFGDGPIVSLAAGYFKGSLVFCLGTRGGMLRVVNPDSGRDLGFERWHKTPKTVELIETQGRLGVLSVGEGSSSAVLWDLQSTRSRTTSMMLACQQVTDSHGTKTTASVANGSLRVRHGGTEIPFGDRQKKFTAAMTMLIDDIAIVFYGDADGLVHAWFPASAVTLGLLSFEAAIVDLKAVGEEGVVILLANGSVVATQFHLQRHYLGT